MSHFRPLSHHDAVTRLYTEEMIASFQEQISEAERLADELNDLLANYQSALEHEGMRGQVETLTRWAERYRHGLLAANKISRNGHAWLTSLNSRLNLEIEELGRLEGEGGHIFHSHHTDVQTEDFVTAARQVGAIASRIEYLFGRPATGIPPTRQ